MEASTDWKFSHTIENLVMSRFKNKNEVRTDRSYIGLNRQVKLRRRLTAFTLKSSVLYVLYFPQDLT